MPTSWLLSTQRLQGSDGPIRGLVLVGTNFASQGLAIGRENHPPQCLPYEFPTDGADKKKADSKGPCLTYGTRAEVKGLLGDFRSGWGKWAVVLPNPACTVADSRDPARKRALNNVVGILLDLSPSDYVKYQKLAGVKLQYQECSIITSHLTR